MILKYHLPLPSALENANHVLYDGRVVTCCMDSNGVQVLGDLNSQSVRAKAGSICQLGERDVPPPYLLRP